MTLRYSDVTPRHVYLNRRRWFASLLAARIASAGKLPPYTRSPFSTDEKPTPLKDVTSYNNFYEFGTQKEQPAMLARNFKTSPWTVVVDGLAGKPKKFDFDEILKLAPLEERIYRHRCVEAWSMVVPWIGFPLNALLKQVDPKPNAKYVAFESYYDPRQMPAAGGAGINFPYIEGLRMDEAMHPLTILCTGLYGDMLPNQNGAPLRLVVPWKYGFKGIKSIVRVRLVAKQPDTTWNLSNAREYGFYSNVNPEVDHPRWTQSKERRIGELLRRTTIKFNGYGDQVASMYDGMDLRKNY